MNLTYLDIYANGTATFLGGTVVSLNKPTNSKTRGVLAVSIGNLSMYHWSHDTNQFTRYASSSNVLNRQDPGGRLGMYLDDGLIDLRNLTIHYFECSMYDTIIVMTDGVEDNFRKFFEFLTKSNWQFRPCVIR